jgi:uncharacterized membrane protein YhhN
MLTTFVLAGIDMFLLGRYRWTLLFGLLAALGRPEVWPFLGIFMIWAWLKVPKLRWPIVGAVAVIAFMWFGIPTITNGRPNISGELAKLSPRVLLSTSRSGSSPPSRSSSRRSAATESCWPWPPARWSG